MGKRFFIITLLILLLFTACIKRECRKKEDSVSGDALEIVYSIKNHNMDFYKEIPDTLFLKNKIYYSTTSFIILDEFELNRVNTILNKYLNFNLNQIDFSKYSYYVYFLSIDRGSKVNVNILLNNKDSITSIIDYIEYPPYRPIKFFPPREDTKLFFIKTNKINFRAYEHHNKYYNKCN